MTLPVFFRFPGVLLGLVLLIGSTGCIRVVNEPAKPDEGIALAASALHRDNGMFVIDDGAVDSIARQADVTADEVKNVGFVPNRYTKPELSLLMLKLRADEEQFLLSTMARKLSGDDAPPSNAQATEQDGSATSLRDAFLAWAREKFKDPAMTMSDVWKKREATLRTVAAKDAARQWVLARLTSHEFDPAIRLTVEVVSTNSVPLLASPRAFLTIGGGHKLALTRKRISCNDPGTACRYVYSRAGKDWDATWVKLLDAAQQRQTEENSGKAGRPCEGPGCDEEVELQMQVAGQLMKQTIALAYLNVANDESEDSDTSAPAPDVSKPSTGTDK